MIDVVECVVFFEGGVVEPEGYPGGDEESPCERGGEGRRCGDAREGMKGVRQELEGQVPAGGIAYEDDVRWGCSFG